MSQSSSPATGTWLEISVTTSQEAVEAVSEMLMEMGAGGVVIDDPRLLARRAAQIGPDLVDEPDAERAWRQYVNAAVDEESQINVDVVVRAYLPNDCTYDLVALAARVADLRNFGLAPGPALVTQRTVHEEDWANAWKRFYTVQHIGQHLVIVPSWLEHEAQPDDVIIKLDPGMAFGTGTHPTTQLCLQVLEKFVTPRCSVLDVGTGSGILAIAAAKLGAKVDAFDIDSRVVAVAAENAVLNGVATQISAKAGTLAAVPKDAKYDIVVANIVADTILTILPDIPKHLHRNSLFIASGIVDNRRVAVEVGWKKAGLELREVHCSSEWVCLVGGLA